MQTLREKGSVDEELRSRALCTVSYEPSACPSHRHGIRRRKEKPLECDHVRHRDTSVTLGTQGVIEKLRETVKTMHRRSTKEE